MTRKHLRKLRIKYNRTRRLWLRTERAYGDTGSPLWQNLRLLGPERGHLRRTLLVYS